ncbi:glycosyltransferase family 2 protein [Methylomonas koyamae]|uniref:glycosyltransferase family 2 protein n=1 Tax=Methylomonas koyamae TaxID=702114 RepID=UPI0018D31024|nr:glycosyltransferase family 2 protein [Methylomonas koyamae]
MSLIFQKINTVSNISVIILTYNEQLHLARCINSLKPVVDDIFVIDSFSTDDTVQIAEALGATVYQRRWKNYADQFQWGLDNCPIRTTWVMRMDADEYLEDGLAHEIKLKLPSVSDDIAGIYLKRKYYFLGRWIRYGDRYPLVLLRLWRKGKAHIENRWMDEHVVLDQGAALVFDGNFVDDNLNNIEWFIDKHNKYASREMIDILNHKYRFLERDERIEDSENDQAKLKRLVKEKVYNHLPIFFRPVLYFFYRYIIRLGFMDGKEGFAYHFMQGLWYRCLIDLKCLEAEFTLKGAESNVEKIARLQKLTGLNLSN